MSIKEELEWFRNENKEEIIVIILLFISVAGSIITGFLIINLSIFFGGLVFYLFPDTISTLAMKNLSERYRIFIDDRLNKKDVNKVFKGVSIIAMFCQVPVITLTLFSYDVPLVLAFTAMLFFIPCIAFLSMAFDSDFSELLKYVSVNELALIHIMATVVTVALFWMTLIFNLRAIIPAGFIGSLIMELMAAVIIVMPIYLLRGVGLRLLLKLRKKRKGEQ